MFGLRPIASNAFSSLWKNITSVAPVQWGKTGGIGKKKKEHFKQSPRAEMKEYLANIFHEPVAKELKEEVKQYIRPDKRVSIRTIDYDKLSTDIDLVQRIISKAQEIQQEQEDELLILMMV